MSDYWQGKRVVVTGASGYLGKPLCLALEQRGASVTRFTRRYADLHDTYNTRFELLLLQPIDVLFHLAADVGGIADNIKRPADMFYNNVLLNAIVVNACQYLKLGKIIALGSSCAYPVSAPLPFVESDYLKGEPEPTNAPYAYSKRLLLTHLQAAHAQYGLPFTYLILANLYGEGCDTNPNTAHVIGALVRKFYEAKRENLESVTLWGSGKPIRDFLHVSDAVDQLLYMGEHGDDADVVNISTANGQTIAQAAHLIATHTGYRGRIVWDTTKPDGALDRYLSIDYLVSRYHWDGGTLFGHGIRNLCAWYSAQQQELAHA